MEVENALCRLSELRKGAKSGGEVVLNLYFDDEIFAMGVSEFVERREFMPRFQERGLINVEPQRITLDRAMSIIVPEEFR